MNLQAQCADLFHFDLPWNPGRMEQRNGRIDRTLQPEDAGALPLLRLRAAAGGRGLEALAKKSERIHDGAWVPRRRD